MISVVFPRQIKVEEKWKKVKLTCVWASLEQCVFFFVQLTELQATKLVHLIWLQHFYLMFTNPTNIFT